MEVSKSKEYNIPGIRDYPAACPFVAIIHMGRGGANFKELEIAPPNDLLRILKALAP